MNEVSKEIIKSIKNLSKQQGISINELRVIVALERIAARLESDKVLAESLVFKGGFVMYKAYDSQRFTRDIDALGRNINFEDLKERIFECINQDHEDGLWFGDVKVNQVREDHHYNGLRFNLAFQIGDPPKELKKINHLSRIHFDIGVGDYIPSSINQTSFTMLDGNTSASWLIYPPEYIFSEKLETLVSRADGNSRAKDIYDLVQLYSKIQDSYLLELAIKNTFNRRNTKIPNSFSEFFESISSELLKKSWASVQLIDREMSFDKAWSSLKEILKKIDIA